MHEVSTFAIESRIETAVAEPDRKYCSSERLQREPAARSDVFLYENHTSPRRHGAAARAWCWSLKITPENHPEIDNNDNANEPADSGASRPDTSQIVLNERSFSQLEDGQYQDISLPAPALVEGFPVSRGVRFKTQGFLG